MRCVKYGELCGCLALPGILRKTSRVRSRIPEMPYPRTCAPRQCEHPGTPRDTGPSSAPPGKRTAEARRESREADRGQNR